MFPNRSGKALQDVGARRQLAEAAIARARELYRATSIEQAREPVLQLQDKYDEVGVDRLELLYMAESSLPGDSYWLQAIAEILMRKQALSTAEIPYLLRCAELDPTRLDLWTRLFREYRRAESPDMWFRSRERCALALIRYFPTPDTTNWANPATRNEARTYLIRCLEDAMPALLEGNRRDAAAKSLIKQAMLYFPESPELQVAAARLIVDENKRDPESVGVVLQALQYDPENADLKRWAAGALMQLQGHQDVGLELLRQTASEHPGNDAVQAQFVSTLRELDSLADVDVPLLKRWIARHRDDQRALELLADWFVAHEDTSEEAMAVYRRASPESPRRRNYLRLMGKVFAAKNQWSDVIEVFNEIRQGGQETEEIVLPLAQAYAEFDRNDAEAAGIYRKAVEMGTRDEGIHIALCRYLYVYQPNSPDSVAQFKQSAALYPANSWAQLGMVRHYQDTGDAGRALDGALLLLQRSSGDREALRHAAKALASDFSRKQMTKLANLDANILRLLYEEAHKLAPDAGPIAMGLVRSRLADGLRDADTARLLGDVCRKNPDATDLRIARADLLWELGQEANALELDRELVERWRTLSPAQLSRSVAPEVRSRVLRRVGKALLRPPGPKASDVDLLLEAVGEPDADSEMILGAVRTLMDLQVEHPQRVGLLEKALSLAPGDAKIERALAEAQAARGNIKPAIRLAIELITSGGHDEQAANLLRSAFAAGRDSSAPPELFNQLRQSMRDWLPDAPVLLAGMELLTLFSRPGADDVPILEALSDALPRNVRVRKWFATALSHSGEVQRVADLFGSFQEEIPDDDVVLQLAKTHARLGRHEPVNYRVARRAVELEPNNYELLFHLAAIELQLSDPIEAARKFDTILSRHPEFHPRVLSVLEHSRQLTTERGPLLLLLARVHCKAGRTEQALATLGRLQPIYQKYFGDLLAGYSEIIAAAPDNARALVERSILYRLAGRIEEAIADLDEAHELAPDNLDILSEYADILSQKLASASMPEVSLCVKVGNLFFLLGDEERALAAVTKALEIDETDSGALMQLARIQLNAGALDDCWSALRSLPDRKVGLEMLQELARAYDERDQHLRAAEVLTDAIEAGGPQRELPEQLRSIHQDQARSVTDAQARNKIFGALSDRAQGRYELREEIGSGSMGVVFKAYDRELDEIVVLKILPEHFAYNAEALSRFRNEAKAARKLAHPNIVRIHDIGEEGGRKHISMEYVAGGDLKQYLARQKQLLPLSESVQIIREIGRALAHAHGEGVLHRDIKSANILLTTSGKVKLSDFGIASLIEAGKNELDGTRGPNSVIGTPLYMSPEQFDGADLTPASDLYSVGVLFYEILSGNPPFTKGSISYHHQFTHPKKLENIPDRLWNVLAKLLRKDPADRQQSAEELLNDVDLFDGRVTRTANSLAIATPIGNELAKMETPTLDRKR